MRIIKTVLFILLLSYCVLFCVENLQRVSLTVPFIADVESIPLFLVIIGCLVGGVLMGSLISAIKDAGHFLKNKKTRSENKHLKKKLDIYQTEKAIDDSLVVVEPNKD